MRNEYKKSIDQIHAPQELIEKTKKVVHEKAAELYEAESKEKQQLKKIVKIDFTWKNLVLAAGICLVLLSGGVGYYKVNNYIVINPYALETSSRLDAKLSLGKIDMQATKKGIVIEEYNEKTDIISKIWKTSESKIKGTTVYIMQGNEANDFYASYKQGKTYCLAFGNNITKKEFVKELKDKINIS